MSKKYYTTDRTVMSAGTEEVAFLVEAWEGIKPSRQSGTRRVSVVAKTTAVRRPSEGKRPVVSVRGDLAQAWRTLSATVAGDFRYTLSTDGVEWELLRTRPGYAPKSEVFTDVKDIKTVLDQIEFGYWASAQHENLAARVLGDLLVTE